MYSKCSFQRLISFFLNLFLSWIGFNRDKGGPVPGLRICPDPCTLIPYRREGLHTTPPGGGVYQKKKKFVPEVEKIPKTPPAAAKSAILDSILGYIGRGQGAPDGFLGYLFIKNRPEMKTRKIELARNLGVDIIQGGGPPPGVFEF